MYRCYWRFAIAFAIVASVVWQGKDSTWFNQLWERFSWNFLSWHGNQWMYSPGKPGDKPPRVVPVISSPHLRNRSSVPDHRWQRRGFLHHPKMHRWAQQFAGKKVDPGRWMACFLKNLCQSALTRPWQRLGYWSFCLLTSWERERGGKKNIRWNRQVVAVSESRICRDSRLPDIANHLQRSRCPSHYTDLATGERWTQGFWNMCRASCQAAIVPPPVIFVSIGVLLG